MQPTNVSGQTQSTPAPAAAFAPQHQGVQPGMEYLMIPRPVAGDPDYAGSGKPRGKTALITGGDSGTGRAAAHAFAKVGASVAIA